jgi:signal peptidase I
MPSLNKLPRIASVVAFVIAGIIILLGVLGPIIILPFAIVPLCAGVGILRKRVWSAYGFATFSLAQLLVIPVILLRPGSWTSGAHPVVFNVIGSLLLGILFLSAGRTLAASGGVRGKAYPWIIAAALTTIPFFFVQTFEIPGSSMKETLLPGDRIWAQTFPRQHPERGKMVIFLSPQDRSVDLIKRVIAVPGDRVRISRKAVILNGTVLDEKYVVHNGDQGFYPDNFPNEISLPDCAEGHEMLSQHVVNGEIVVPPGGYFVLGDNRENSLDSRCWGFVQSGDVIGKPLMIYDSIEQTPEQALSPSQDWLGHRRWSRLFTFF